jgi:cell wall-associated NlpC family hydrolase
MVKQVVFVLGVLSVLSSCTALKSLNLPGTKPAEAIAAVPTTKPETKFLDITVTPPSHVDATEVKPGPSAPINNSLNSSIIPSSEETKIGDPAPVSAIENASQVQLKYSVLLNTELESLPAKNLLESVDEWYGVRYRRGGNTKGGVDCSGFTVAVYSAVYGIALPRVSTEQWRKSRKISTTELQQGDLVFFKTRGSYISHVGIYLSNNYFIHASVSQGVMVNNLFEPYYLQRFAGAGRIEDKQATAKN